MMLRSAVLVMLIIAMHAATAAPYAYRSGMIMCIIHTLKLYDIYIYCMQGENLFCKMFL